jgi:hypothetical protein
LKALPSFSSESVLRIKSRVLAPLNNGLDFTVARTRCSILCVDDVLWLCPGNCRLECQYAMQQDEVEMIPLLMEEGCKHRVPPVHPTVIHRLMHRFNEVLPGLFADKAKGWLGLLMGSRMYGSRCIYLSRSLRITSNGHGVLR